MKINTFKNILFMLIAITVISSCKKEDTSDEETSPIYTTNTPPSNNYYAGVIGNNNSFRAYWTEDFTTYKEFTSQFDYVQSVKVINDTVLIVNASMSTQKKLYLLCRQK